MSIINIATGNHGDSPIHLEDFIAYLASALRESHFDIKINNELIIGQINLLIEYFDENSSNVIISSIKHGTKIIIVVTEAITGETFNDFQVEGVTHYSDRAYWNNRYRHFCRVADNCHAIWCLSESLYNEYRALYPNKTYMIPLGFVSRFARTEERPNKQKDIDFLFTGSLTQRRSEILDKFRNAGFSVRHFPPHLPSYIRENVVSRAKISLTIAHSQTWKYKSEMRIYYHLMNGSYISVEDTDHAAQTDAYCQVFQQDNYVENTIEVLKDGRYSEIALDNLHRFIREKTLPPRFMEVKIECLNNSLT